MAKLAKILAALLAALALACENPAPAQLPTPTSVPSATIPLPTVATAILTQTPAPTTTTPQTAPSQTATPPQAPTEPPTPPNPTAAPQIQTLRLEPVLTARRFESPTNFVQAANDRVLITEQEGRIWLSQGTHPPDSRVALFLDITDRVSSRRSEEGLLGIALDPQDEHRVYLYYSAARPRRSVVSRFTIAPDYASIDPDSELVILQVEQPYANHNGGQIAFGPDGYLYVGLGDGGSAGDPLGHGQDISTLLGSILRIDVSRSTPQQPYAIPPDNPFAQGGGRAEIWAYGLRNPWRFSFDRETGDLWAGDVGQNRWEEIDLIHRAGNYGWNVLEGTHCFGVRDGCPREGFVPPVWEYSLSGEPCSVIGGYVYRGAVIPGLQGAYIYGDYCSGEIFALRQANGQPTDHRQLLNTKYRITSLAQDNHGELYLLTQKSGVYRLSN